MQMPKSQIFAPEMPPMQSATWDGCPSSPPLPAAMHETSDNIRLQHDLKPVRRPGFGYWHDHMTLQWRRCRLGNWECQCSKASSSCCLKVVPKSTESNIVLCIKWSGSQKKMANTVQYHSNM